MRTRSVLAVAVALFAGAIAWTWVLDPSGVRIDFQFALVFVVGLVAFLASVWRQSD